MNHLGSEDKFRERQASPYMVGKGKDGTTQGRADSENYHHRMCHRRPSPVTAVVVQHAFWRLSPKSPVAETHVLPAGSVRHGAEEAMTTKVLDLGRVCVTNQLAAAGLRFPHLTNTTHARNSTTDLRARVLALRSAGPDQRGSHEKLDTRRATQQLRDKGDHCAPVSHRHGDRDTLDRLPGRHRAQCTSLPRDRTSGFPLSLPRRSNSQSHLSSNTHTHTHTQQTDVRMPD